MTDPIRKDESADLRDRTAAPRGSPTVYGERRRRTMGWRNKDVLRTAALVIAMYVGVRMIWFASPLFLTAFLGILFGLAVSSGADHLVRWHIRRAAGAALVVMTFIGLLVGFGTWVAPTIRVQSVELRRRLPEAIDRLELWVNRHNDGLIGSFLTTSNGPVRHDSSQARGGTTSSARPGVQSNEADSTSATPLRDRISRQIAGATRYLFPFLSSTLEVLGGLLIILFLAIYIGADPDLYHRGLMQLFPRRARDRAGEVLSAMATVLRRWLVTQLIAMVVIGTVTTVVLLLLDVKAAFALGILAGLLEFIPTVGPILSAVPAVAMGFLDSPEKALYVAIAFWAIQFAENHLLIPLLMKGGVDVPPALTILSQALMAILFGFLGLMCAVPILAATMIAVKMLYVEDVVGERVSVTNENPATDVAPA
ncbi:MAG TPA: AI-2E family transporter [Gemmatimonadaceae bacterium]|nr:AI-2E family transporter [Gemmatimonadaceae bacterium]